MTAYRSTFDRSIPPFPSIFRWAWGVAGWLLVALVSCRSEPPRFTKLRPEETGIWFTNEVHDSDSLNILDYIYFYNGGGVAAGDFNNDGLTDLYFSANQGTNKLYVNNGNLHFEEVTSRANVAGRGNWKTGVTLVDINGDGRLDIYLSAVGNYLNLTGKNQLFVNTGNDHQGVPIFSEQANAYGLDMEGFNTQATFFDFDRDGDLDVFIVNHSVHSTASYGKADTRHVVDAMSGDKLLRNDRLPSGPHFTDVTAQAGIYSSSLGYGLNVVAADFNNDGWDDLYVSNDFHENDYYYLNQKNGSFAEINQQAFAHESRFSMGSDVADVNNDGWLDLITLDMLPADETVLKTSAGDDPLDIYQYKLDFGYHHQYSRNCLQLNVGGGRQFSDVALAAGVAATDWSWSPVLADFDNDGWKDLFVSNGIQRRPNNLDYVKYTSDGYVSQALAKKSQLDRQAITHMPAGKVHPYLFQGTDSLRFVDQSLAWGFDEQALANGSVAVDLDNDGDLDLVTNAVNEPAGIYQNNAQSQTANHYLAIHLDGDGQNPFGIGAKVILFRKGQRQFSQQMATRGFESSSLSDIHFGLGSHSLVDTVAVLWPDGRLSLSTTVQTDQRLVFHQRDARPAAPSMLERLLPSDTTASPNTLFEEVTDVLNRPYQHRENPFNDFGSQPLLPHQLSTQGPKMAVGDVNGDGRDDFYVCGAKGQAGQLFQQTAQGHFKGTNQAVWAGDTTAEEVDALFFDANNDNAPDLYVVTGGNESEEKTNALRDKLYLNDGKGGFTLSGNLPAVYGNKSVVTAADLDHDGDQDLFVGGRAVAGQYGVIPSSYLLLNNGQGQFSVANLERFPDANRLGLVTDAVWADVNGDGWADLVVVGEWMPITVYLNRHGQLDRQPADAGLARTSGLWQCVNVVDLDADGDLDLLAGNWGENTKLKARPETPLRLYVADFDHNGRLEQLLACEKEGVYYPFAGKEELEKQLPGIIRKNFTTYQQFAGQSVETVLQEGIQSCQPLLANTLASLLLRNDGHGHFAVERLPGPVQWAPVFSFLCHDVNHDGQTDVLVSGNFYGVTPYQGRYDASRGCVLLQAANHALRPQLPVQSGLQLTGEVRDSQLLRIGANQWVFAFARNNDKLLFFRLAHNRSARPVSTHLPERASG